ncbi:SMP-30/gluconolactonase/LRE family protein [Gaoshiqia sediminis]|uniref:SMP-30/gluconolactonase/LRE family protein n=1 Tax=Gaoshiqia sediminis TaxID=2986998 RepID=A0AA42C5Z3_9BACT|nr:SMP-30/gluconolactonase/LRE family protein [Gaoshiqia sediminis]MCW0482029.1 SMP-30/gluconolactonase/LRE family protein [Gaoshiqia sediminis]
MKPTILLSAILLIYNLTGHSQNLKQLIPAGKFIETIASGFAFTEGPAVNQLGEIFFTDQPNNKIYIWSETGGIRTFEVDGERANGLFFHADGDLVACADYHNKLIKISMNGEKTTLVDGFDGKHLNGPNDLWIHPNGNIYITDSYYHRPWWPKGHQQEQDCRGVYCVKPNGEMTRVIDDFEMPNGIIGSPDGQTLYVADINARKTWKYRIQDDGTLADKTFFAPEGSDGMTIDHQGNVYLTNKAVSIFSFNGEKLGELQIPETPSNVCFGGKKRKTLFITARTSVYKIGMKVRGVN